MMNVKYFNFALPVICPLFLLWHIETANANGLSNRMAVSTIGTLSAASGVSVASVTKKRTIVKKKAVRKKIAYKPAKRFIVFSEVEAKGFFPAVESLTNKMCIQEVPFFVALYKCYFLDERLDKKDTLVLSKPTIQALLRGVALRFSEDELTISPVSNIDSLMIFRAKSKKSGVKTTNCNVIVFARPDAYEIPKTGAKIVVPKRIKGAIVFNPKNNRISVTLFSKGVRLDLPSYAKILSLGMISDMDIKYAELQPLGEAFEARLLYPVREEHFKKRGWSLNITECNKIRPYAR